MSGSNFTEGGGKHPPPPNAVKKPSAFATYAVLFKIKIIFTIVHLFHHAKIKSNEQSILTQVLIDNLLVAVLSGRVKQLK